MSDQGGSAPSGGRILLAKIGLDGHDRGIKVIARTLRDAGFEVIYTGLFQTPENVVAAAIDEDVDAIGISMLSGAHEALMPLVTQGLNQQGSKIPVVLGGIVPEGDVEAMTDAGVAAVLPLNISGEEMVSTFKRLIPSE